MRQQIEDFLTDRGYDKLKCNKEEMEVYIQNQPQFLSVIFLIDAADETLLPETYQHMRKQIIRQLKEKGFEDVHLLTLLVTKDVAAGSPIIENDPFAWVIDAAGRRLIVPEGHVEDYYGLKRELLYCLCEDYSDESEDDGITGQAQGSDRKRWEQKAWVNYSILFVNVVVYTICIFGGEKFFDFGTMYPKMVTENGAWYQLVVSMFFHASAEHLFGNLLLLYLVGDMVECRLGHISYFILYMTAGVAGNLLSLLYSLQQGDMIGSLGASGAIYGVVGAFLWLLIQNKGRIDNILLPKALFMFGYSLYLGFTSTQVDNAAHIGGLLAGFLSAVVLYRKGRLDVNEN